MTDENTVQTTHAPAAEPSEEKIVTPEEKAHKESIEALMEQNRKVERELEMINVKSKLEKSQAELKEKLQVQPVAAVTQPVKEEEVTNPIGVAGANANKGCSVVKELCMRNLNYHLKRDPRVEVEES